MHQLIDQMFVQTFANTALQARHDASVISDPSRKIAMTTDSYVIHPFIFPGGNIGSLSVIGTVNDLAMAGAVPKYLTAGFILEEGLPMEDLWTIVVSMQQMASACGVEIITGDTKVVDKGKGDGLFINTSGVGFIDHDLMINPSSVRDGDAVIVSGDLGRHGMAIMAVREGLSFESAIESDVAASVHQLIQEGVEVHCLRDLTRGGLASALNEIAEAAGLSIAIEEALIPVREDVQGACAILGFDPLYVACEGRFALFVPAEQADIALNLLTRESPSQSAALIGHVRKKSEGAPVTMLSRIGVERIVDMLSGEQLPRIC